MPLPNPYAQSGAEHSQLHKQNASHAYKNSSYHGISERETMAEAFRVIITNLYTAKDLFTKRTLDLMCEQNIKTLQIVQLMAGALEDSSAFQDAESRKSALFMANLYNDVYIRLTNILQAPSPAAEFDALIAALTPVYRRWLPSSPEAQTPAAAPTGGTF